MSARGNSLLAKVAQGIAGAMQTLESLLQSNTNDDFKRLVKDLVLTFSGEVPGEFDVKKLIRQLISLSPAGRRARVDGQSPPPISPT